MKEEELNIQVRLSCQRALLGAITANIRMITVDWNGLSLFKLRAYFINQPTDDDIDNMNIVSGEILCDISFEHEETECFFNERPMNELDILKVVVYERKE